MVHAFHLFILFMTACSMEQVQNAKNRKLCRRRSWCSNFQKSNSFPPRCPFPQLLVAALLRPRGLERGFLCHKDELRRISTTTDRGWRIGEAAANCR